MRSSGHARVLSQHSGARTPAERIGPDAGNAHLFSRDGLFCAALYTVCVLLTWPVAEIGINDDWSYIRTAQVFAHTHHFVYNGWATAMLGWQVIWGALSAWIFGASFTAIRLSMIPVAILTVLLFHAVLRGFGLNRAHAVFGTLTLTLCPLFLALSDTFMSDVPGLFSLVLCIYLCQRALRARADSTAAIWLAVAGLTNILSGTVRQISWLGVLVMVPCCAWLLRRRRYTVPTTIATWLVGVVSIKLLIAWFLRHPYSIPETILRDRLSLHAAVHLAVQSFRSVMSTLLFLLPILVAFAASVWPPRKRQVLRACIVAAVLLAVFAALATKGRTDAFVHPWLAGDIVTPHGVMQDPPMFGSSRHAGIGWMLALLVIFVLCLLGSIEAIFAHPRAAKYGAPTHDPSAASRRETAFLLLPVLFFYCLLLAPRAAFVIIFDRYLLVIMAIALIYMLRAHQQRISPRIPLIASVTVAVIAALGAAATHDLFAIDRAEVRALAELQKAGVPRVEIRGGFDFDSITQVETAGYLNDPHLINPPGSYHPHIGTPDQLGPCGYGYLRYTPSLRIRYVVSADPSPCLGPTGFPPQTYRTWLPPARRKLFVGVLLPQPPATTP